MSRPNLASRTMAAQDASYQPKASDALVHERSEVEYFEKKLRESIEALHQASIIEAREPPYAAEVREHIRSVASSILESFRFSLRVKSHGRNVRVTTERHGLVSSIIFSYEELYENIGEDYILSSVLKSMHRQWTRE